MTCSRKARRRCLVGGFFYVKNGCNEPDRVGDIPGMERNVLAAEALAAQTVLAYTLILLAAVLIAAAALS